MRKKLFIIGCLLVAILSSINASAAEFCADEYAIDQSLPNGSRWDMCWTHDANQGVRYHHIHYTPKNGSRKMVMYDASIAQIHVPYDDNGARYHDVSDFGLGGDYLLGLSAGDCQGGTRAYYNGKAVVCRQVMKDGTAYRNNSVRADQNMLKVFSISRVGEYLYSAEWRFYADGRIVPSMLATGALQRFGDQNSEQHGWLIANAQGNNRIGLSHMHNFYWRLDFDLDGTGENDVVQEINYDDYAGKQYRAMTQFDTEAARSVDPSRMRTWLIKDNDSTNRKGHNIAYEIRLMDSGQREVGPAFEPFTEHDFYVTKSKSCEKVASHNRRIYDCAADNLKEYVNGESLKNQDIVAWVGVSFYHMPRSEDAPYMDAHVSQYEIVPRDWHTTNALLSPPTTELRLSASDDYVTVAGGDAVLVGVQNNDTGNGITFNTLDNPTNGTATIVNNKIRYVANAGYQGTDIFWYSIKDVRGNIFGARIYVTVTATNNSGGGGGATTGGGGSLTPVELLLFLMGFTVFLSRKDYR